MPSDLPPILSEPTGFHSNRRWPVFILCLLLGVGAFIRFDGICRTSLWVDEYWALYLATGRGNEIFDLPRNKLITAPPAANFKDAPPWWHIWNGVSSTSHPPLYHIVLRGWVDIFGDSDLATRSMSSTLGLLGIVALFDLCLLWRSDASAVLAAGMMTFAPSQIDWAQQDRPYTLLALLAVLLWNLIVRIERKGASPARLITLGLLTTAILLAHYFSLGIVVGALLYVCLRLRGHSRRLTIFVISAGIFCFFAAWGLNAWHSRHTFIAGPGFGNIGVSLGAALLDTPRNLLLSPVGSNLANLVTAIALGFLLYLSPIVRFKRDPLLVGPWLWLVGAVAFIFAIDLAGHTQFLYAAKYTLAAAPAVFIIAAAPWGARLGGVLPVAILMAVMLYGADRWQGGSDRAENTADVATALRQNAGARDAVVITGTFVSEPAFRYFVISHYAGDWHQPVVLLTEPADRSLDSALRCFAHVWVVGKGEGETGKLLPAWRPVDLHNIGPEWVLWRIEPR